MQQFAHAWLGLIVDISIKSMLLAGVAGLALSLFRLRDTNLRHRVWTAVLFGMLAMPALVYVTPAIPLPSWLTLAIPNAATEPNLNADKPNHKLAANLPPNVSEATGETPHVANSNSGAFAAPAMNELPPNALGANQPLKGLDSPKANSIAERIQTAEQPSMAAQLANRLSLGLASMYFSVAFVFLVRLLVGLALTHRLIGQAREIRLVSPSRLPRRRSLRLLESNSVYVPATAGFARPVVLLPMSWRQWSESKLQAVLAHEFAHVRRADWLVITLAELNRAIYWFHPLAWFLQRRLSELAELNCDDAVLEADGDRTQYARYLLEVASSLTVAGSRYGPPLQGVAMARNPNVETRIDAILDGGRPLARRLGTLGAITLVLTGATAILVAAALRTAAADGPKKPNAEMKTKADASPEGAKRVQQADNAEAAPIGLRPGVMARVGSPSAVDSLGDPLPDHALVRLGALRFKSPSGVEDIALSPDEQSVVTVGEQLIVWDAATGKERWRVEGSDYKPHTSGSAYGVRGLALSSERARFFTPGRHDEVIAWDISSGQRTVIKIKPTSQRPVDRQENTCQAVDVTGDGTKIALGRAEGVVVCSPDGQVLYQIANKAKGQIDYSSQDRLTFAGDSSLVRFSPYGRMLAVVTSDTPDVIRVVESETGQELQRCKLGSRLVRMAFSPDGKQIATTERDTFVRLYDVGSGKEVWTHSVRLKNPYENYTSAIAFAPDGKTVAACATDNSIYLLDAATGEENGQLVGTRWYPWALAFTADSKTLYSSGWDGVVRRWDVAAQKQLALPKGFHATGAAAASPDGLTLACEDDSGAIRLLDATSGAERRTFKSPDATFSQLAFSPDSRWLAGGGSTEDKVQVAVWDVASGKTMQHWDWPKERDPHSTVESLSFTPNGKRLAAAVFRQSLAYIWDMTTGKQIAELKHSQIYGLSFSPDGKTLATAGWDSIVRFWDADTGKRTSEFDVRRHRQNENSKDASTEEKKEVKVRNGPPQEDLRMYTVCYAPSGGLIATAHMDGIVQIWKTDEMTLQTRFNIGGSFVYGAMSFSPDGLLLATGSAGGQVALWDPLTGKKVADVGQHRHYVYTVGFGREARRLLSGGEDGVCYLWDVGLPAQRPNASPDQASPTAPPAGEIEMKGPAKNEGANARAKESTAQESRPTDKTAGSSLDKTYYLHGRVLDPDGKPVAGATVYAAWAMTGREPSSMRTEDETVARTQSDAQGNYELTFLKEHPDPKRMSYGWRIAAVAAGFGPAWQRDVDAFKNTRANAPTMFTLPEVQTVAGRFVDLEGNPLAGIHVRVYALKRPENSRSVAEWIADAKKKSPPQNPGDYFYPGMDARTSPFPAPFPAKRDDGFLANGSLALPSDAVTDRDGRVHFGGLGADQLAILEIEGPSIAKCLIQVVARDMQPVSAQPSEHSGLMAATYYGREFQFVAGPTQPVVGKVTDAETGDPLANVEVAVDRIAGNSWAQTDLLGARTDNQGRYQIVGAPRGGGHYVKLEPALDQPYFPTGKELKAASGFDPITCDFSLRRGRWITGKITDHDSKAPIAGAGVEYLPLRDNEHAKDYSNYDPNITGHTPSDRYHTAEDGSFHVLAIPGRGILAGIAHGDVERRYISLSKETAPKNLVKPDGHVSTYHPWTITGYHVLKEVEIAETNETIHYDLELTRGLTRIVKMVDMKGEAVKDVRVLGRTFPPSLQQPLTDSSIEVVGLRPNDERDVVFIHSERRIGKAIVISPGDATTVTLEPCAIARGRVVNDEGQPVRNLAVKVTVKDRPDNWMRELIGATTDEDGRFEVFLPPGTTFRIWHYTVKPQTFDISAECRAEPGAVFELGDLTNGTKLKTEQTDKMIVKEKTPSAQESRPTGDDTRTANRFTIRGGIVGADGKPAEGVDVAVIARRTAIGRGGDLEPMGAVLGETKTDSNGRYQIELVGVSSKTHRDADVIARASGTGLAWRKLNLDAADVEASIELQPEETITGRLVDIEGQPAAGVHFQVSSIMPHVITDQWPPEGISLWRMFSNLRLPTAWPAPIVSDGEGRFVIHSVPKDHGISLEVEGNDRFAPQDISLNTGMAEQRGERDGTYRPLIKNFKPGEETVLPLAPAQLFTGTVRYEDTGEPAPHARLTIWSSQQKFGSMISVAGKADDNGRYKISPSPGIRFGVTAYPPDGAPYLVVQRGDIPWEDGARSKVVDMRLPRGVLVNGKVVEQDSNTPIAGASVQYIAEEANNPSHKDQILTGWQDIHLTDKEGRFKIVVLPGPGRLLVHAPGDNYVLQETSGQELYKGKPGGRRNYAHAIEKIDPAPDSAPPEILIRLKRGATVRGELVGRDAKPIDHAEIFSQLHINAASLWWRGFGVEARDGRFELSGLASDREYPVYFLDSKRRLGATLVANAGMESPRVVLEPCGDAKMRFVDNAGKPVAKYEPTVELVVTPGALEYSRAAMNAGALAADADFIANIDRANHSHPEKSDDQGRLTVRALIPGATYRVVTYRNNEFVLSKEFKAVAKETIDLGDITVERKE